jgi:hypothetical protein
MLVHKSFYKARTGTMVFLQAQQFHWSSRVMVFALGMICQGDVREELAIVVGLLPKILFCKGDTTFSVSHTSFYLGQVQP